ncbi:MAG: hypothetical protein COX16_06135 [Deltaproteobacteria bacterium CG23_combo_of_CG06-09_8_20_14_all_51_20]|nr:MAG: hypothetical protein AUK25_12760 [Desulfobacteraceae bacterium CG2_30_51_40]PIP47109.1 MAG: hypothetical protein COX16_06135 [Deltaproteobacteria bacterium CG23_combo_of_CG06-09_8_20_14_all_51_20]PIY22892.1 MAG: hypothetical protein COZ11_10920 [Deltaproteobacteria bacterium CG_4_10_14_3_um_filter_51_14]PJB38687.1 MAG: hypothetical protein CO107_01740 [Deltaproteobacteria bacterium CG_4_9_14_3_um_filter_51_14]
MIQETARKGIPLDGLVSTLSNGRKVIQPPAAYIAYPQSGHKMHPPVDSADLLPVLFGLGDCPSRFDKDVAITW